jgi:hypothetical protein
MIVGGQSAWEAAARDAWMVKRGQISSRVRLKVMMRDA